MADGDKHPARGPVELKSEASDRVIGRAFLPSGPANPRQRVGNGQRAPQAFDDLRKKPDLTGTWLDRDERFWIFVNHVGDHLQGLVTLVATDIRYHEPRDRLEDDVRIPLDWGVAASRKRHRREEIAFRFRSDGEDGVYFMTVPRWIGKPFVGGIDEERVGTITLLGGDIAVEFEESFVARWPDGVGRISTARARSIDSEPVLLERYVARSSVPWMARTLLWFPATPRQLERTAQQGGEFFARTIRVDAAFRSTRSGGSDLTIYDLLQSERSLGHSAAEKAKRDNIVTSIDEITGAVFGDLVNLPISEGGTGQSHVLEFMRPDVLRALAEIQYPKTRDADAASMLTTLQRAMDGASENGSSSKWLKKWLGLERRNWREHVFEVELKINKLVDFKDPRAQELYEKTEKRVKKALGYVKVGKTTYGRIKKYFPLTQVSGRIKVRYTGWIGMTPSDQAETWTATYSFLMGGVSMDQSFEALTEFQKTTVTTKLGKNPPLPHQLEGVCSMLEFTASAGGSIELDGKRKKLGAAEGAMAFMMYGDGKHTISPIFEGVFGKSEAGAGLSAKPLVGTAWLLGSSGGDIALLPKRGTTERAFENYWKTHIPSVQVHFATNGAKFAKVSYVDAEVMRETGRLTIEEALRAFTACELPLFADSQAKVVIDGYTDRQGDAILNEELSLARAKTVSNYLEALLGPYLKMRLPEATLEEKRLALRGFGEVPAAKAGDADGTPNIRFRRVDLAIGYANDDGDVEGGAWEVLRTKQSPRPKP